MDIKRAIESEFLRRLEHYPVVTVVGPRQSGKTTLVRRLSHLPYINLEKPDVRAFALEDPNGFLNQYPDGAILDEVQRAPILLSYIQVIVDEKKRPGQYILTGSHQVALHDGLAQSLAGRTTILTLLPLSFAELREAEILQSTNNEMLNGFYPRIYHDQLNSNIFYSDYVKTYLERDVRYMINIKDLMVFQKFLRLCASRTATVLNMNDLAKDVGVSHHTIREWIAILSASYLIELVAPYFENFGKRMIKSPKLYFTDVGLVSYLLNIESVEQMQRDPLRGRLYETMVAMELFKARYNKGKDPNLYFYRDSEKKEVDLIYKYGAQLSPIEIKSTETYSSTLTKGTQYFKNLIHDRCGQRYLIYAGNNQKFQDSQILNHHDSSILITQCDED